MTIAELAKIVEELKETLTKTLDKLSDKSETTQLLLSTYDGRIKRLEDSDGRRQKLIDSLVAAFLLMAAIEIIRLVASAL